MITEPALFRDLAYVFLAAVVGGALARLARQPLILGYVLGGLLVSPLTPGPSVSDVPTFERFAEIGVVLLMFSLGIEFSLKDLMGVKWIAVIGGPLGIVLSIGLGLATATVLGWSSLRGAVVGMGAAALTQAAGLSLALGAFLAGLLINESDYAHEMLARLLSLRDAFIALFFVTLGVLIDPRVVVTNLNLLGVLVGLIVIGNWAIWTTVTLIFRQPLSTALLVGVGLTQIGEFSFILVQVARQAGHVGQDLYNATLAASLVTILINAFLVRLVPSWIGPARLDGTAALTLGLRSAPALAGHVVLCGFGRVGSAIGEALETFGGPYVAVETDPDIVKSLRARNVPAVFGDAPQRGILAAAPADRAALVILAIPENDRARLAVQRIPAFNPTVQILARLLEVAWRARLMET